MFYINFMTIFIFLRLLRIGSGIIFLRCVVTLPINHVMSNKKSKIYFKLSMGLSSEGETVYNPETIRWLNPILDDENLEEERILAYKEKRRERYKNSTPVRS